MKIYHQYVPPFSALVTGGTGFIGSALVARLVEMNCKVWVMSRLDSNKNRLSRFSDQITILNCDLSVASPESISSLCPEVDVIFHLAAAGVHDLGTESTRMRAVNVQGTKSLLEASRDNGVPRFIHVGSCFEYGGGSDLNEESSLRPKSVYALTKMEASEAVLLNSKEFGYDATVLRPFMIYGPGELETRLIPHIISQALQGKAINLTGGEQVRDLVFIDDAVDLLLKVASSSNLGGQIFNICSGQGWKVKDVAVKTMELTGSKSSLNFGALPYRVDEAMCIVGNPEKAANLLAWTCSTDLESGIRSLIHHIEND